MLQGVIFDIDGTLVETVRTAIVLLQEIAQATQDTARAITNTGIPMPIRRPAPPPAGFSFQQMVGQLVQFVGYFLAIGAVGFRFGLVRRMRGITDEARIALRADNAAFLGMLGVFLLPLSLVGGLYLESFTRKVVFSEVLPNNLGPFEFKLGMLTVALIGFRLVRTDRSIGWGLALVGMLCAVLQPLYTGRNLSGKVNAVHILAASTWLGTLLVLTLVGIRGLIKRASDGAHRALIVSDLVNSFSPLALIASAIVVITGATTAWLHLKRISALWTTSYGIALLVKLILVALVVVLGAWNWKRVRPSLGTEGTEHVIRRSATMELTFAALVLIATSVLVTLPSPK